jgi:hypothetical protein
MEVFFLCKLVQKQFHSCAHQAVWLNALMFFYHLWHILRHQHKYTVLCSVRIKDPLCYSETGKTDVLFTELLGFWTFSIRMWCFGNWICFHPQMVGEKTPTQLGSLEGANLNPWTSVWVWVLCYDWRSVGQSVLVQSTHPGLTTRFLFPYGIPSDSWVVDSVGRPLWREDGSVFCICCWPLPAQSFSGPSPLGLAIEFTVSDLRLLFSSAPMTRRVTVEVFDPASTWVWDWHSYLIIWDQAKSVGDNKKLHNKNCDEAPTCMELG